ncbi:hypothetical protein [Serinibacter arcticus]|uniref:hypothetical protein n=1 Tax=Serinibacter arcticus TaxID=1655435 RepID=UPI001091FE04|nr:hypothetical protein [Serinibacter arcticus]
MSETDGVDETFDQTMHVALTAAARAGETIARMREESHRRDTTRADGERAQLETRFGAEQQASVAQLDVVRDPQWWDKASREDVVATWQLAHTWREDPAAARAIDRMREEVKTRYGADVGTDSNGRQVDGLLQQASADRYQSSEERNSAQREQLEANRIVARADRADQAHERISTVTAAATEPERLEAQAEATYDSAERRQQRADQLEQSGVDKEVAAGVLRADVGQARPATDAVRTVRGKAARGAARTARASVSAKVEPSR